MPVFNTTNQTSNTASAYVKTNIDSLFTYVLPARQPHFSVQISWPNLTLSSHWMIWVWGPPPWWVAVLWCGITPSQLLSSVALQSSLNAGNQLVKEEIRLTYFSKLCKFHKLWLHLFLCKPSQVYFAKFSRCKEYLILI